MIHWRIIFIVLGSSILGSCSSSVIYDLYTGHVYDQDVSILFCKADSTYVYSNSLHSGGGSAKEIGEYKTIRDTIFLYPQFDLIRKNKPPHICRIYDCCKSAYATIENDTVVEKCIDKRIYVVKEDLIQDYTLEYHFPNDSNAFRWNEDFALQRRKILQSKREKSVLYSRKVIDRIW